MYIILTPGQTALVLSLLIENNNIRKQLSFTIQSIYPEKDLCLLTTSFRCKKYNKWWLTYLYTMYIYWQHTCNIISFVTAFSGWIRRGFASNVGGRRVLARSYQILKKGISCFLAWYSVDFCFVYCCRMFSCTLWPYNSDVMITNKYKKKWI